MLQDPVFIGYIQAVFIPAVYLRITNAHSGNVARAEAREPKTWLTDHRSTHHKPVLPASQPFLTGTRMGLRHWREDEIENSHSWKSGSVLESSVLETNVMRPKKKKKDSVSP